MKISYLFIKSHIYYFLILFILLLPINNYPQTNDKWVIKTSLKCDAFSFLNAISKESMFNSMYPRECELWKNRLGKSFVDTVNDILDSSGGLGFKASYLFTYLSVGTLSEIIKVLEDSTSFSQNINDILIRENDYRYVSSIKDLKTILQLRNKLIFVFTKMKECGWEDDWNAISKRLEIDINLKKPLFEKYSPYYLCKFVDDFLKQKIVQKDSSSKIYYLYYAYPNGFKLPYNMMATWNIEYPTYFFSVYMHERLHSYSIYAEGLDFLHNNIIENSPSFAKQREIMTKQLYESDEEFYILAAEAYLSIKAGLRTKQEAENYLKTVDGGTALYSLFIFEYLENSFDSSEQSYSSFLQNEFLKKITPDDVENFILKNSKLN